MRAGSDSGISISDVATAGGSSTGEIVAKVQGGAVHATTATPVSVEHLDLDAGVWEVSGHIDAEETGGNALITEFDCEISLVDNTQDFTGFYTALTWLAPSGLSALYGLASSVVTLAVPTRVYLVANVTFTANGVDFYGTMRAQRVLSVTVQP